MKTPKYVPLPKLKSWLQSASTLLKQQLCDMAGTSDSMYRQWVVGRRAMSADLAGRVARATQTLYEQNPTAPKPLTRGDLCEACRNCELYQGSLPKTAKVKNTDTSPTA